MVTFGGAEWERGRFSKIRARQSTENEQGYNFISGFYRLGPKLRPASAAPKSGSCVPAPPGKSVLPMFFVLFCVTAVTDACNGYTYGYHAAYVCQGCQAACLTRIGSIEWRLVYSFAAVFTDLSLRPETVPTASVASFDYD